MANSGLGASQPLELTTLEKAWWSGGQWAILGLIMVLLLLCVALALLNGTGRKFIIPEPTVTPAVHTLANPMLVAPPTDPTTLLLTGLGLANTSDVFEIKVSATPTITNLTQSPNLSELWPVPSPDGTRLAFFSVNGTGQRSLGVRQANGSVVDATYHSSASGLFSEYEIDLMQPPIWSPDGVWLAFLAQQIADEGSAVELFIAQSDGTEVRRLTYSGNQVMSPVWLDNTDLAYVEARSDGRAIVYKVSIAQPSPTPESLTSEIMLPK